MKKTIWVVNTKGGVGKTTVAMYIANAYRAAGHKVRLIDCDVRRKLAAFMAPDEDVMSLDIGATADEIRANPTLAISYWDRLADEIADADDISIVDLGANVDRMVWQWAERSKVGEFLSDEGIEMDLFVPTTAEPLAVEGALELLKESVTVFPNARKVLVLNQVAGSFDSYAGTQQMADLTKMRKAGDLKVVAMPRCLSEGWVDFERLRLHMGRVLMLTPDQVQQETDMGRLQARRALGDLAEWVQTLYTNFKGVVPEPEKEKADRADDKPET